MSFLSQLKSHANANGFDTAKSTWPAERIQIELLDELAKLIVAQPSKFV